MRASSDAELQSKERDASSDTSDQDVVSCLDFGFCKDCSVDKGKKLFSEVILKSNFVYPSDL